MVEHETGRIDPLKQSKDSGVSVSKPSDPSDLSCSKTACPKCGDILDPDSFYAKIHLNHCEGIASPHNEHPPG
jgi:hypothetical protein